ncbi:unnamed protein product [Rotaria sp. Silwood2]|nr:unnamed protein product [Rotaria sp. Silwood2]CAF4407996.1 unnamed protein product [Rotaria sp. Silwood2]
MWLKNDFERYHYLVILHTICTIAFIIRFIVLCTDLSSAKSDSIAFPVVILLLELGSSFITFIANFIYIFLRYLEPIIFESDREKVGCCSQSFAWNLSTLTCFLVFEVMRFIAFILACVCANRYGPIGLGYLTLAAFSLIPAVILLVVEYLHHHRLWFHYRPDRSLEEKPHYIKEHLRFLPIAMTNDQQTSHWQNSRCDKGERCLSRNLYHVIIYHSGNTRYPPEQTQDNQIVVGFHQTSHAAAYSIAKTHLGKTKRITKPTEWSSAKGCDTVYFEHPNNADEFCVQNLQQIRSWIIVIDQDPNVRLLQEKNNKPLPSGRYVEDRLEDIVYQGYLF